MAVLVESSLQVDVISIVGNAITLQLNGSGAAAKGLLQNVSTQSDLCQIIIDAWGQ